MRIARFDHGFRCIERKQNAAKLIKQNRVAVSSRRYIDILYIYMYNIDGKSSQKCTPIHINNERNSIIRDLERMRWRWAKFPFYLHLRREFIYFLLYPIVRRRARRVLCYIVYSCFCYARQIFIDIQLNNIQHKDTSETMKVTKKNVRFHNVYSYTTTLLYTIYMCTEIW